MMRSFYLKIKQITAFQKQFFCFLIAIFSIFQTANAQKLRVLFVGNSFTGFNDLQTIVRELSHSAGDSINVATNAPGGYTLEMHATDVGTRAAIATGDWNYVVLQEQSQRPALADADVAADVFPYATILDSFIHATNKCGRTVFFQTWGYRDGDVDNCPSFTPVCTFNGMDSMLALRYDQMAFDNFGLLAPVGTVFKELRIGKPGLDLYDADGRHPSFAGSYAAAVTFYTILFGKDPRTATFNYVLPPADAAFIRQTVFLNVYNKLPDFYVGKFDPIANFSSSVVGNTVSFNSSTSNFAVNYKWSFGDGNTSISANPVHSYTATGTYSVKLVIDNCILKDSITKSVSVTVTSIKENQLLNSIELFPNPASSILNLKSNFSLEKITVNISSVLGAIVMKNIEVVNNTIDISNIAPGVYFIQFKDENTGAILTKKFIKE